MCLEECEIKSARNELAVSTQERCNGIPRTERSFGNVFVTTPNYSEEFKIFQRLFLRDVPARMGAESFAILQDLGILKAQNTILN